MVVAALFVRQDSIYKTMPGVDAWDIERDARKWPGGCPVVAHPPCRAWGRLRQFAKPRPDEKQLGMLAVCQVQRWGGVLEHPAHSTLWKAAMLPSPGEVDDLGGWTLTVDQFWWGHLAEKRTWLYIVGIKPAKLPAIPLDLGYPGAVIRSSDSERRKRLGLAHVSKADREKTPAAFAHWLVAASGKCQVAN